MPLQKSPIVQMRDITKAYGAVQALSGVSLDLYPGEVQALVGDNPAGQTHIF